MAVTRTVQQTVNALVSSYKTDIQKAAGNNVLSKLEQATLSSFAKRNIENARKTGETMTVSKAVAALKPVITRAAKDVAGSDGLINENELKKFRVKELRTRAASLFEAAPTADRSALLAALKGVDVPKITDYGRSFGVSDYSKNETIASIVSDIIDVPESDLQLSDWATRSTGRAAVSEATATIRSAGKDAVDNADDAADGADTKARLDKVADAVAKYFKPTDFKQVVNLRHSIAEDGDVEYNVLLAQKKDSSWVAFVHSDFPF